MMRELGLASRQYGQSSGDHHVRRVTNRKRRQSFGGSGAQHVGVGVQAGSQVNRVGNRRSLSEPFGELPAIEPVVLLIMSVACAEYTMATIATAAAISVFFIFSLFMFFCFVIQSDQHGRTPLSLSVMPKTSPCFYPMMRHVRSFLGHRLNRRQYSNRSCLMSLVSIR